MKVLVTGGSGFIGQRLVDLLLAANHEVLLLSSHDHPSPLWREKDLKIYKADLLDRSSLEACARKLSSIDVVIHLAALVPKTNEDDKAIPMLEVNVKGTVNLLEVFGSKIKRLVYASTAEVYGLPEDVSFIDESYITVPVSYYGASKLAGELFCRVYTQKQSLPLAILRFTVIYGPGDTVQRAIPNFIRHALNDKPLEVYGGEELRDYLHIYDAADALYLAATSVSTGIFNIGTGHGISILDTAKLIVKKIDPGISVKVLPRQKKAADVVLNIRKAQQKLGYKPKHIFPELIEEQITWQKNH